MSSNSSRRRGSGKGETPKSKNSTESPRDRRRRYSEDLENEVKSNGTGSNRRLSSNQKETPPRPSSRAGKGASQKRKGSISETPESQKVSDKADEGTSPTACTFEAIDIIRENGSEYVQLQMFNGMPGMAPREHSRWDNLARGTISSSLKRLDIVEERPSTPAPRCTTPRPTSHREPTASSLRRSGSVTLDLHASQNVRANVSKNSGNDASTLKRSVSNIDFNNKSAQKSVSNDIQRTPSNSSLNRSQSDLQKSRSGSGRYEKEYLGQVVKLRRPKHTEDTDDRRKSTDFDSPVTRRSKKSDNTSKRWSLHLDISSTTNFTGRKEIASPTVAKPKRRAPSGGDYSSASTTVLASTPVCSMDLDKVIQLFRVEIPGTIEEAKSENDVQTEKAWLEAEKVWLVHKGGFASSCVLKSNGMSPLPEGRVRIKLDHGGDILEVDEDDVEKANPPQFDRAEDLASLRYLNESSALHTLRQRYGANLIHTYAGNSLVVVNPMHPIAIYSDKVIQVFKGCKQEDMPPHIYASAQIAYRDMLNTRMDQSIILMGRSGSGKTCNARHVMNYFTVAAGSVGGILTSDKLQAVTSLLEAFGNSRTILNTNASRFSQLTTLDFDHSGQITSASIQVFLFEKTRVVRRPEGEPSFHVFYQMLAGIDSTLRSELQLTSLGEPNLFMTPLTRNEDRQKASAMWAKIFNAMITIGISEEERKALCYVLAAIYHLGVAGAAKGQNNKSQFSRPAAAQKAAALLGVTSEELARQIFSSAGSSTLSRSASMRGSPADKGQNEANTGAMEALEGFVIGLYADVFNAIVSLINRSLSTNYRTSSSVTIVDMPGFQNPATCGRNTGSTFEDLCYNYTQEKLQLLYHDLTFTSQQDRYSQENIDCDFEFVTNSPSAMVSLIDKQAQQLLHRPSANRHHGNDSHHSNHDHLHHGHEEVRTSSQELKESDKKGLLWILDEEAIFPGATEDSFMDRFFTHHGEQKVKKDSLLRKASSLGNTFILNHFQGTNPVTYNASGWLKGCRENPLIKIATQVLQDSKRQNINELFNTVKAPVAGMVSGSIVGMEGSTSLKRVGSMRRTFMSGTAGLKKRSMCLQVKFQVDSIIETLRKSRCHFVHCILPQQNAGLWELKQTTPSDKPTDENLMNVPLVRAQIRGIELLDAVRMYRQGFPDSMAFAEFRHRFEGLLSPANRPSKDVEEKQAVATILDHLDIDKLNFRVGLSKVFFRAGALSQLEMARDEKIAGTIVALQARCRGYLGRKALEKLRIKHIAISCIQKNVRKLMLIKDWTWWKLFTKVQPLLDVHRTEEELKSREIELEQLKSKVERLEKDRTEYKTQCDKLESRLSEATADLAEEHETATHATEMLDAESAERMRLEKELKDIQAKYAALKRHSEKVEMEMTQLHLWQAQALEGDLDEDLGEGGDSIYKDRYERAMKELNVTRKRMEKQHEEDMETEHNLKKAVEKRLHEAIEDAEDQRRQLQAAKKKASRLASEMQDTKLHLEEQMSRNNDLERKQRRFDSELNKVQEEIKEERHMREKIQRERDQLATDKIELEQEINRTKSDLEEKSSKVDRLNNELMDLTLTGTKGSDQEVMNLKKAKHELDMKVKEQEEELDDQAGQIQQLEQTKVRLEMNLERQRQSHMKEMEEKEEDIEEMRYSTQKKLKHIESQLEEEYEEKKKLQQDKRELERQMAEIGSKTAVRDKEGEKRLKRDLKKTKALLRDAETVLQKHRSSEGSKNIVRALRNKVDDAEFAAAAALKAKKTMELEIQDLQQQLDEVFRTKTESENKAMSLLREKTDIQNQLEENEEDLNETMRKYKAVVQQGTVDQITINDQLQQIEELTGERDRLKQEVLDLQTRVQGYEENSVDKSMVARLEGKIRDLENRLQLEVTAKHRLEVQVQRMKEQLDKLTTEKDQLNQSKVQIEELLKKNQRQLRDLREEFSETQKKEMEVASKNKTLETKVVDLEADFVQNQADLKLAFKRISDLQAALEEDLLSDGDSLLSDSDDDASDYSDDDGLHNHRSAGSSGRFNHLPVSPRSHQSLSSSSSHDYSSLSSSHTTNGASHA